MDPLSHAAMERFRVACDDGARDAHPDLSAPRERHRDYAHLGPWLDAAVTARLGALGGAS